ncbi:MAG TPA: RIP metalloprotease RseP, partial [Bacillota bacterium]|nr:RIP metalloprotease RseP [Bacillota bacterium]
MQALSWIGVIIAVVLLFGAAVFVHEFGHFWMARRRGLKVEGFSIGFGPKIFGWTRDGIDYAWRWIPAGGYVKLPQMITSEALEGKSEETPKLPPVSPFSKILVALAGPVMNALFAFAIAGLIYVVGLPVRVSPAILGQVEPGTPEAQMGLRPGDRIVAVNGKLVKSWEDAQMIAAMAPTNRLPVTFEREGVRTTQLLPTKLNEQLGLKLLDLEPMEHPVIEEIKAGSAAEAAGLKKGDQVLSFAGVRVVGQKQL